MSDDDLNGYAPILKAMESWKDAGVLDAPARLDALSKSLRTVGDRNAELAVTVRNLTVDNEQLRADLDQQRKSASSVEKELAELRGIVKTIESRPAQAPVQGGATTLNMSVSGLAEQLGEVLTKSVADVVAKAMTQAGAPVVQVPTGELAAEVAKGLGEALGPMLKAAFDRPEPQPLPAPNVQVDGAQVFVDMAQVAKAVAAVHKSLETIHERAQQPPQVNFDASAIVDAVGIVGRMMMQLEKAIDRMQPPDLTPVLKRIDEGNAAMQKVLAERNRPKQKRISHDPNTGDLIVNEE